LGRTSAGVVHRIDRFATSAKAFISGPSCGALSGPLDRYGARIAWIATFTAAIAILRAVNTLLPSAKGEGAWLKLAPRKLGTMENQI